MAARSASPDKDVEFAVWDRWLLLTGPSCLPFLRSRVSGPGRFRRSSLSEALFFAARTAAGRLHRAMGTRLPGGVIGALAKRAPRTTHRRRATPPSRIASPRRAAAACTRERVIAGRRPVTRLTHVAFDPPPVSLVRPHDARRRAARTYGERTRESRAAQLGLGPAQERATLAADAPTSFGRCSSAGASPAGLGRLLGSRAGSALFAGRVAVARDSRSARSLP